MPSPHDVIKEARSWIGVRWAHQGRTRQGVDCVGLVAVVVHNLGLSDYDFTQYERRSHGGEFLKHFRQIMSQKPIQEQSDGDMLVFRDKAFPCHAGILAHDTQGRETLIHAHATKRKVVEHLLSEGDWADRRVACFKLPGLE